MKLKLLSALALTALVSACGGDKEAAPTNSNQIRIATEGAYAPFNYTNTDGSLGGFDVDIANALCTKMAAECTIEAQDWDGIIPALTSKKIDMIIGSMSITEERLKTNDFTDKYYNTPTGVMGAKGVAFDATPEGLAGKTIGVQVSTVHQVYANKYFGENGATVKEYQTQDEANQDLAAGRIDAVQADAIALGAFLKSDQGQDCCELKGNVKDDPAILGAGVGIGLRKGEDDLKTRLNAAIKAIRENGTYDTFSKKYFDFDIYGG